MDPPPMFVKVKNETRDEAHPMGQFDLDKYVWEATKKINHNLVEFSPKGMSLVFLCKLRYVLSSYFTFAIICKVIHLPSP
jgi:hypothetical protein